MYYFRAVRNSNHFAPDEFKAEGARSALTDREGGFLSVYLVPDEDFAKRVAAIYSMHGKLGPEAFAYILIPSGILARLTLTAVPDPGDIEHTLLKQCHHEIQGLDSDTVRMQFAEAIRDDPATKRRRVGKPDMEILAQQEVNDTDYGHEARALIADDRKGKWRVACGLQ